MLQVGRRRAAVEAHIRYATLRGVEPLGPADAARHAQDYALGAYSNEAQFSESLGITTQDPEATVQLEGYSVKLSAAYDDLTVAEIAEYLPAAAERKTLLGHPAYLYPGRTIGIVFDDGKASTGPGGVARTLLVAKDPKDGGGSYEIAIWRQDDVPPDETALLRVAEQVLPTVPGWTAGG